MSLSDKSVTASLSAEAVTAFLERLASGEPTPGGGSAAALAAAQGGALLAMVARLSRSHIPEAAAAALDRGERLWRTLAGLIDADAQAFDAVMTAYRLPRATPEERAARTDAVQQALVAAAEVPLEVGAHAVEVLRALAELARTANPNVISDVGVAAALAAAGANGALFNVAINVGSVKDVETAQRLKVQADEIRAEATRLAEDVLQTVRRRLDEG